MKKYFYFLLFSFCFLLIITCTTQPQSGNLSGTIHLENQEDHSGIVVGVYELATLDPDIAEANTKWPHIGVIINQHTEFDHRFGTLIKTGETDASGAFEINDIPTGMYNIVVIKNGYGFRYIYEISISDGDNSITEKRKKEKVKSKKADNDEDSSFNLLPLSFNLNKSRADLILFPETIISTDITEATTFESYHHYIIEDDLDIYDELTIQPGAVIRLNEGKEITSYGTFNAVGEYEDFIWFTKNDGFSENLNTIEPDSNLIWDRVTLEPYSQAQVQWCKFDWANIALLNHVNGFEISDCIFRDSQCGFKSEDVDSCFCSNLLCNNTSNDSEAGIYFIQVTDGLIERNVINNLNGGLRIKDESNPEMKNNYILCCNHGIDISWNSSAYIYNNEIVRCEIGIFSNEHSLLPPIEKNIIQCRYGIKNGVHSEIFEMHYNNMNCTTFNIILDMYSGDIIANYNYYYTINETEIENKIFDKNDVEPSQQQYYGRVNYIPFLTEENPNAGIQIE